MNKNLHFTCLAANFKLPKMPTLEEMKAEMERNPVVRVEREKQSAQTGLKYDIVYYKDGTTHISLSDHQFIIAYDPRMPLRILSDNSR